jgi:hypothetical protein
VSDPNDKVADVAGRGPDPQTRTGATSNSAAAKLAGTPLGAALGAISSIPREQLLEFLVTGVRALFSQGSPSYRSAPSARPPADRPSTSTNDRPTNTTERSE